MNPESTCHSNDAGEFYCPRFEGCPHCSRVYCYRTTACPMDEFIIQLEVTMVDPPRRPCPPAFSWNGGMVQHVLKSDPALRELEHIQVDGPGLAYLFFYDRHGHQGLTKEAALAICSPPSRYLCRMDREIHALRCSSFIA